MTDILRTAPIFILLAFGLACYFLVFGALFPARVEKTAEHIRQSPWRAFGIGLVNFLFFGTIVFLLLASSEGARKSPLGIALTLPALIITILMLILLSFGLTAVSAVLGERLFPESAAWKRNFFAAVVLGIGSSLPTIGWFLLFPYAALTGFGAVLLTYFQRNK